MTVEAVFSLEKIRILQFERVELCFMFDYALCFDYATLVIVYTLQLLCRASQKLASGQWFSHSLGF